MAAQNKPPQDLSPDLKEIYDRVMNTPAKSQPNTQINVAPAPSSTPSQPPINTTPPSSQTAPSAPALPSHPPMPPQQGDSQTAQTPDYLTSSPPRPLEPIGVKSFSGGAQQNAIKDDKKPQPIVKKSHLSKPIIILLTIVFFGAWTFFWYVFFFNPFGG